MAGGIYGWPMDFLAPFTVRCRPVVAAAMLGVVALPVIAEDWPHFLGPGLDLRSPETGLKLDFGEGGPDLLWEVERGGGHPGPVVSGGKVVFTHQVEDAEEVRCLRAEDGETIWKHRTEVRVEQSFGIVDAPRSSPVIDGESGLVFVLGNDGDLVALELETGEVAWEKSLPETFGPAPNYFGYGSCPLPHGDRLVVQAGAPGAAVAALDKESGETLWRTEHEWHGSYASPVVGEVNGEERIFVFAGGKSDPPTGGLLCLDPVDGRVESAVPWRSDNPASVNAASPVPCGPNRVFITEDYGKGGAMIEFDREFRAGVAWTLPEFGCQFQTPLHHEGTLYGFGGNGGLMMAVDAATGRVLWSEAFYQTTVPWEGRPIPISLGHAHLVHVDGAFLCLSENGALLRMELSPGGYRLLSAARLFYAPETWAPPVISGGRLFVNQNEMGARLLCYDVRKNGGS